MLRLNIIKQLPDFTVDIDVGVDRELLVLFGPSGCGKTTTLRLIAGLEKPDEGRITMDGKVYFDQADKLFISPQHRKCGYVSQNYALFPHMDVTGNILYGAGKASSDRDQGFTRLIKTLKISHLTKRFPAELSGGEKQRVALARALMSEPSLLLLDEPFSALDWDTRKTLGDELTATQRLWGIPFILVTHDREEAKRLGDRILFMEDGKLVNEQFIRFPMLGGEGGGGY
jgi:molybdate transport system ATP-binding protein